MFQYRVVAAPVSGDEASLLMREGTSGRQQTTGFGGGFGDTGSGGGGGATAQARTAPNGGGFGDDDGDDGDGGSAGGGQEGGEGMAPERWGEEVVLPVTRLVKPAWTMERYSKSGGGGEAAPASQLARRSTGGLVGGSYRTSRKASLGPRGP